MDLLFRILDLESELRTQLNQAGRGGADNLAEGRTADVAVNRLRPEELGVVENVERFDAELERLRFGQSQVLEQRHIEVLHAGTVEIAARGVARRTERVIAEQRRIEIGPGVSGIRVQIQRTGRDIRFID